jgi:hypothetical protein
VSASILAIDPGYEQSAWVEIRDGLPVAFAIEPNATVLGRIKDSAAQWLAVELVASYGMAVGAEVFGTVLWAGRFIQHWIDECWFDESSVLPVYRRDVKLHLCGVNNAKDANIRQALIDRYGPGKAAAVGLKASPGPLYGVSKDVWAALAVAVTAQDTMLTGEQLTIMPTAAL